MSVGRACQCDPIEVVGPTELLATPNRTFPVSCPQLLQQAAYIVYTIYDYLHACVLGGWCIPLLIAIGNLALSFEPLGWEQQS